MEEEAPKDGEVEREFSADRYAAEAMAADMDPWNIFNASSTPRSEFDSWLDSNRPSQVRRFGNPESGTSTVGWIAVLGPDDGDPLKPDLDGLQESWEKLLDSGRPVSFQNIKELALNHDVLAGKWLMHLDTGFKVDQAWECVARATLEGKIYQAKVSPRSDTGERHVICMYNNDFTDEEQVVRLDSHIRASGVKCGLSYKPDVYTHLGIYRNNRWKLCPTIYESKFNLECVPRCSLIINKVTNMKVS